MTVVLKYFNLVKKIKLALWIGTSSYNSNFILPNFVVIRILLSLFCLPYSVKKASTLSLFKLSHVLIIFFSKLFLITFFLFFVEFSS